jgi:hypothetical protein
MRDAPVRTRPSEGDVVAQQQLAQPVTGAHQITPHILACPDQVTQRLLLGARNPHRVQTVDHQQPHQPLRVTPVGLHLVLGRALDLPRCRDHTLNVMKEGPPGARDNGRLVTQSGHEEVP